MTKKFGAVMEEISEVIGEELALILAGRLGGSRIYCNLDADLKTNPVALAVGEEAARKLFEHYSGEMIELPTKHAYREYRDDFIRTSEGINADQLALMFGLSRRQVFYIRSNGKDEPEEAIALNTMQGCLFSF
jgi:hypothetical protein